VSLVERRCGPSGARGRVAARWGGRWCRIGRRCRPPSVATLMQPTSWSVRQADIQVRLRSCIGAKVVSVWSGSGEQASAGRRSVVYARAASVRTCRQPAVRAQRPDLASRPVIRSRGPMLPRRRMPRHRPSRAALTRMPGWPAGGRDGPDPDLLPTDATRPFLRLGHGTTARRGRRAESPAATEPVPCR